MGSSQSFRPHFKHFLSVFSFYPHTGEAGHLIPISRHRLSQLAQDGSAGWCRGAGWGARSTPTSPVQKEPWFYLQVCPKGCSALKRPIKMPINIKEGVHPQNTVWGEGAAVRVATCGPGYARCRPQRWPTRDGRTLTRLFHQQLPMCQQRDKGEKRKSQNSNTKTTASGNNF